MCLDCMLDCRWFQSVVLRCFRIALSLIEDAEEQGLIAPDRVSHNSDLSILLQVCCVFRATLHQHQLEIGH